MGITIALAGNPNSGKTTLFNNLTGSKQYVGNWPGVTVEKKTGTYRKDKEVKFTDLPGIYSLSPYTLEEVVSREYLLSNDADVIIDVIDAANIERNLYLATQLSELGLPLVIALNMMDVVRKNGDRIDTDKIEKKLNCKVVEISALRNENIDLLIEAAKSQAGKKSEEIKAFSPEIENILSEIEDTVVDLKDNKAKRWLAIKIFERDPKIFGILNIKPEEKKKIDAIIDAAEEKYDDDGEGIITDERYSFVTSVTSDTVKKGRTGLTVSDKIDKVVTNRLLAIPIFAAIITLIYYVSVVIVAGPVTDLWADGIFGEAIPGAVSGFLENAGVSDWLVSLVSDGIVGGVGAVIGFLPVIAVLFFFISILEDVGYMARIAFILDRIFRRFGLSGKSFIPILVGLGCSVSGITGTRTIENDNDRRMTIICASFMPCGAKMDYIGVFAAVFAGWWYGPIWFLVGILAVIVSGVILKKTRYFSGDPAPFVMELPEYHMPSMKNVFKATWERCRAFLIKAGTIILLSAIVIWFLENLTPSFEFVDFGDQAGADSSILAHIGRAIAWIFKPLGFDHWVAAVATVAGLVAKEELVNVIGIASRGIDIMELAEEGAAGGTIAATLSGVFGPGVLGGISMLAFMIFNQLTIPCFAALGAIREEMGSKKWFGIAVAYQLIFSYTVAMMVYQIGAFFIGGAGFTIGTAAGFITLAVYLYLIFRPTKKYEMGLESPRLSVEA